MLENVVLTRAEFIEDEKPSWDAATVNPPLVLGEVIHQVASPDKLNTSVGESSSSH